MIVKEKKQRCPECKKWVFKSEIRYDDRVCDYACEDCQEERTMNDKDAHNEYIQTHFGGCDDEDCEICV